MEYLNRGIFSLAGAILFLGLYYPFSLCTLESTYLYFGDVFNNAPKEVAEMMIRDVNDRLEQMKQYKKRLDENSQNIEEEDDKK